MWADCTDQEVAVWISDNGVGMDEETFSHIFEKYYRGGGSIRVDSAPGEGSIFCVTLPVN